jgi:hypothetical protein
LRINLTVTTSNYASLVHQLFEKALLISTGSERALTPDLKIRYVGSIKPTAMEIPDTSKFTVEIGTPSSIPELADWLYNELRSQERLEIDGEEVAIEEEEIARALRERMASIRPEAV